MKGGGEREEGGGGVKGERREGREKTIMYICRKERRRGEGEGGERERGGC